MSELDVVCESVRMVTGAERGGLVEEGRDYECVLHLLRSSSVR